MELDELFVRCILMIRYSDGQTPLTCRIIAKELDLSYAGARKRLIRLVETGLVMQLKRGVLRLTEEGVSAANALQRDFAYIYAFLRCILELEHEEADRNAYIFLGRLSDQSREKLKRHVTAVIGDVQSIQKARLPMSSYRM